eukprot:TRINITY_DN29135_c0_g1_i1.p1 TRINITY_DN29135_c0_g1~~TRINITY_DN29135_c0_g1_i1.p1  ORF type:complete len:358 (+),score=52.67 TRINITY_DN29135_c0_g1_i1:30-1103(+)
MRWSIAQAGHVLRRLPQPTRQQLPAISCTGSSAGARCSLCCSGGRYFLVACGGAACCFPAGGASVACFSTMDADQTSATALIAESDAVDANGEGELYEFVDGHVRVSVRQRPGNVEAELDIDKTGDLVWPTAVIFCRYLCAHREMLRGQRVLDLGAGTGLVGLVASTLGARPCALTDVPRVLPLLQFNASAAADATNAAAAADETDVSLSSQSKGDYVATEIHTPLDRSGNILVKPLWWGDQKAGEDLVAEAGGLFDVMLCCEVVYQQHAEVLEALTETVRELLVRPGGRLVIAYQWRDGAEVTDHAFFDRLPAAAGLRLLSNESLRPWDDSWDDLDLRRVHTYVAEELVTDRGVPH